MDKSNTDLDFSFINSVDDFLENDAPSEVSLKRSTSQAERWRAMPAGERTRMVENLKQRNIDVWSNKGTYILRSPGVDLLDYYDEKWHEYINALGKDGGLSGKNNGRNQVGGLPPSMVYKIRYEIGTPRRGANQSDVNTFKNRAWSLMESYIDKDTVWRNYHMDVYKQMYSWLTCETSKSYEFRLLEELYDFMDQHLNMKVHRGELRPHSKKNYKPSNIWWRKEAAGWSVIFVED